MVKPVKFYKMAEVMDIFRRTGKGVGRVCGCKRLGSMTTEAGGAARAESLNSIEEGQQCF